MDTTANLDTDVKIVFDNSVSNFLDHAGDLLYQHEAVNSLMLGLCEGMLAQAPKTAPLLMRVIENNKTVSAAIQTPPMNLIITYSNPEQLELLATTLKEKDANFTGVVGPAQESESFASIWTSVSGKQKKLGMGQKIYKIEEVAFPKNVAGEFAVIGKSDLELFCSWVLAFAKECLPPTDQRDEKQWREFSERGIEKQTGHFWIVDGEPVAMAITSRPTKQGVSISGVYTPPKHRKKGYASAVVAHLSQKMLDSGKKFCVLYTDLTNPTSNKIYQNVGYREVCDSKHFFFV
jgi:predicted GNAT family acetyltransferase